MKKAYWDTFGVDSGNGKSPAGLRAIQRGATVADLLFVGIMVAFFVLAAIFVAACERIIGSDAAYEKPANEVAEPEEAAA